MPKIKYVSQRFNRSSIKIIEDANLIVAEYQRQGFTLTLRQLYYQFVSRGLLPNKQTEYKRLGAVISSARLAGEIDWNAIEDRTRNLTRHSVWDSPGSIVSACASQFAVDRWGDQAVRVEVWIEKEALANVFERPCDKWQVPYICCRGYMSQSEMWAASQRLNAFQRNGQKPVILHFGDHDPSGLDMTRDISDRLVTFMGGVEVRRLALNMDQVQRYNPPPNPAKWTDVRAAGYVAEFGESSWELDALDPATLAALLDGEIRKLVQMKKYNERVKEEKAGQERLRDVAEEMDG